MRLRLGLAAIVAIVAAFIGAPALAQTSSVTMDTGPSLLWVWVWILLVGILVFIVGTSMGVRSGRR